MLSFFSFLSCTAANKQIKKEALRAPIIKGVMQQNRPTFTIFSLVMAHRIPLVAAILPLLAMIYLSGYSNPVLLSGVALSYIASILCLRLSRMFRSIYEANDKFRLIFSVLYAFLTILFPAMYILTSSYALAQFVLTLIFGMALVGFILYTMKIYSPEQLSDIGWKNLDQEHMGTIPTEGSIGDKLAIVLTVLIVLTIVFVVVAA